MACHVRDGEGYVDAKIGKIHEIYVVGSVF